MRFECRANFCAYYTSSRVILEQKTMKIITFGERVAPGDSGSLSIRKRRFSLEETRERSGRKQGSGGQERWPGAEDGSGGGERR